MTPPEPTYPRSVTPGIETHERVELEDGSVYEIPCKLPPDGIYVGLDWIRCTAPDERLSAIQDALMERFGSETRSTKGAQWFRGGIEWEPGVQLSWGHSSDIVQVDIRGERLSMMDGSSRVDALVELVQRGMKPTRLDGALDWVGQGIDLCVLATAACLRKELCLMRKFRPGDEFTSDGIPTRRYLALGSRESPVFARIYDKGLQQAVAPAGHWERLEVEWKEDRAPQVAGAMISSGSSWPTVLRSLIFGAVEFRERNGRSERSRRPMSAWWRHVLEGCDTVKVPPALSAKTLERWRSGFIRSYGRRLLELADSVGRTPGDVVEWLLDGVKAGESGGSIVSEFVRGFRCGELRREA